MLAELVATLRAAGAEIVDPVAVASLGRFGAAPGVVLSYEFKDGLDRYLAEPGRATPMKSLAEVIAFNEAHRDEEMPYFAQEIFLSSQARGPLTEKTYVEARETCVHLARAEGIDAAMDAAQLDALVMFTKGTATLTDVVNGEGGSGGSSSLAAVAGYPSVTVPATQTFGLPIGLSFVGRAWSEPRLLALAADFESRTHARRVPEFLPTADIDWK